MEEEEVEESSAVLAFDDRSIDRSGGLRDFPTLLSRQQHDAKFEHKRQLLPLCPTQTHMF